MAVNVNLVVSEFIFCDNIYDIAAWIEENCHNFKFWKLAEFEESDLNDGAIYFYLHQDFNFIKHPSVVVEFLDPAEAVAFKLVWTS